jgi:hypothetical protein
MLDDTLCVCVGMCVHTHTRPPPHVVLFTWDISFFERQHLFMLSTLLTETTCHPEGLDVLYAIIFVGLAYEQWKDICV